MPGHSPDPLIDAAVTRGRTVVFMDVSVGGNAPTRLRFELFTELVPKTCENFRKLCTGEVEKDGRPVGYKGSAFHRIVRGFMIQGGDFVNHDGTGSFSIYGATFPDESLAGKHDRAGLLSMANTGPNTNGCQFFVTTAPAPWLDGKHVVFGRVLDTDSLAAVRKIEAIPTHGESNDSPKLSVTIAQCGEL